MSIHIRAYIYIYICMHIFIYIYIHFYIHTYVSCIYVHITLQVWSIYHVMHPVRLTEARIPPAKEPCEDPDNFTAEVLEILFLRLYSAGRGPKRRHNIRTLQGGCHPLAPMGCWASIGATIPSSKLPKGGFVVILQALSSGCYLSM